MSVGQIVYLDVDKIHANRYNPNVMIQEKFEALVDFCETHAADKLDPIWVRHDGVDRFEVIDGEHRWKAAKEVGWKRLRAFIIEMEIDDAKAFNVRKNRERGQLDAFKLGRIFRDLKTKGQTITQIGKEFGYAISKGSHGEGCSQVSRLIALVDCEDKIRERLSMDKTMVVSPSKAIRTFRELKREERGEPPLEEPIESQQLEKFLRRYARALKNNPLPKVQKDEVTTAIDFFKRLLEKEKVHCPICGEAHLQWRCGHEF